MVARDGHGLDWERCNFQNYHENGVGRYSQPRSRLVRKTNRPYSQKGESCDIGIRYVLLLLKNEFKSNCKGLLNPMSRLGRLCLRADPRSCKI